jgi:hypothetical protein
VSAASSPLRPEISARRPIDIPDYFAPKANAHGEIPIDSEIAALLKE